MSRGYWNYENEKITNFAEDLEDLINRNDEFDYPESEEVLSVYEKVIKLCYNLSDALYAIDSYLSSDWGEQTLLEDLLEKKIVKESEVRQRITELRIEQKYYLTLNKNTLKTAKENGDKIEKLPDGLYKVTYKEYLDSLREE